MTHPTRSRIIEAATAAFAPNGYSAVGIKRVVERAGATLGSIYHFFPGGKDELCAEVVRTAGKSYGELIDLIIDPAPDAATGIRRFFSAAAETLESSDFADACPIATIALEAAGTSEPVRLAASAVFEGWLASLRVRFEAAGIEVDQARSLSVLCLAALEGAFLLCRTSRDADHLRRLGVELGTLVASRLPQLPPP